MYEYATTYSERLKSWLAKVTSWFELIAKFIAPFKEAAIVVAALVVAVAIPGTFERPAGFYEANTFQPQWAFANGFWGTPGNGLELLKFDVAEHDDDRMLTSYQQGSRITLKKSGIYLVAVSVPLSDKGLTAYGAISAVRNNNIAKRKVLASVQVAGLPEPNWSNTLSGVRPEYFRSGDTLDLYLTLRSRVDARPSIEGATLSVVMVNAEKGGEGNMWSTVKDFFTK